MAFTHLHVHSQYSILDGLPNLPDLVACAKNLGMTSLALTDHGVLYGAIEFYQECTKQGIKPIIGAELYVAQRNHTDKQAHLDDRPYHLIVLAETYVGYKNLIKLISTANLEGYYYKPRVDLELLAQHHDGLIALSGCLNGQLARTILNQDIAAAEQVAKQYQTIFGVNNYFLEVQHNPTLAAQTKVNDGIQQLSQRLNVPIIATADSHYLTSDDADAQDILLCIQTKKQLSDTNRLSMRSEDYSLAGEAQMLDWFKDFPNAVSNTTLIAERCNVELKFGEIHMPYYALPAGDTAKDTLRKLCITGIQQRYTVAEQPAALTRLDYELEVITKTGYESYFLIVQDLVNWARKNDIVVGPGRGSAAGSIVAYATGITNIDPIKYDLLFERFLNPERVSMPDIDLDIADTRRDDVIHYAETKYGKDHVSQIVTFGTLAARAAVRDVGRVLGLSYGYCDTISKMIPPFTDLAGALETVPELKELYQTDHDATRLLDQAIKLEGVVRHTSTHACGVIITEKPLQEYTPIQYSSAGDQAIVSQYSLHSIESLGLLKMDFLGLKNLTVIEDTIDMIKHTLNEVVDVNHLPLDNKPAYKLLQKGQTTGIFQLESSGMKRYLRELKPTEFEDIIAMVALYRPGPMERIPEYITGKHKKRTVTYLHPSLKPILEKTYGILVYQEQVMALSRDLAGFTAGEGYLLIKAVAKKISALLDEQREKFISGCAKNNISQRIADQLWEFIEPFARYGFNKSHSTGYALIAYQTAYLKANYPAQFMASLLTSDQSDSDRIAIEVAEAREIGISVLPPDINESLASFTVVNNIIRFGLSAIKNVGENLVAAIITERLANGLFKHTEDFLGRIQHKDLNKKSLESLIKSGAMSSLGEAGSLLTNLDLLLHHNKQIQQDKHTGQTSLFSSLPSAAQPQLHLAACAPIGKQQKLQWEKELLGLYVSAHPLSNMLPYLPAEKIQTIATALSEKHNAKVKIIGLINFTKRIITKKGEQMQFVQLEDPTDQVELVIFPSVMSKLKTLLSEGDCIQVQGKLSKSNGQIKILAEEVSPFMPECLALELEPTSPPETLNLIKAILEEHAGKLPVYITIKDRSIKSSLTTQHSAMAPLQQLLGETAVHLV